MTGFKDCAKCGTPFQMSRTDATIHCPACRKTARRTSTPSTLPSATSEDRYALGKRHALDGTPKLGTGNAAYLRGYAEHAPTSPDNVTERREDGATIAELAGADYVTTNEARDVLAWCREWCRDTFAGIHENELTDSAFVLRRCDALIDGGLAFVLADVRRVRATPAKLTPSQTAARLVARASNGDTDARAELAERHADAMSAADAPHTFGRYLVVLDADIDRYRVTVAETGLDADTDGWTWREESDAVIHARSLAARDERHAARFAGLGSDVLRSIARDTDADDSDAARAELARRGEDAPYVLKMSSGEDGYLWYLVDVTGAPVSGSGYVHAEHAEDEREDVAKIAALSPEDREHVAELRASTPAPGDYGLAVLDANGDVSEYRYRRAEDRNVPVTCKDERALLSSVIADYRTVPGVRVLDASGDVFTMPDAETICADIRETVSGLHEVMAGEPGADADAFVASELGELRALVAMLTDAERDTLTPGALELAGYVRVHMSADGIGVRVWPRELAETVATFARDYLYGARVSPLGTLDDISDGTVCALAGAYYVGGLDALRIDAEAHALTHERDGLGTPVSCQHSERDAVTCGTCGAVWCGSCDPAPSALCHTCHGRGYSIAEVMPGRAELPSTPGAFGHSVDVSAARIARDAARDWTPCGELAEDVRTVSDILSDLPAGHVPRFLAHVARARPWSAVSHYGADILDAIADAD